MYVKLSKCIFAKNEVSYLGHIISGEVKINPSKVTTMVEWRRPRTVRELRGFLRLTGYYHKFIRHYGLISQPLTNLLKKKGVMYHGDKSSIAIKCNRGTE